MSYTYAILDVTDVVYKEVRDLLKEHGYGHAFHDNPDGEVIDMHGIALRAGREAPPTNVEMEAARLIGTARSIATRARTMLTATAVMQAEVDRLVADCKALEDHPWPAIPDAGAELDAEIDEVEAVHTLLLLVMDEDAPTRETVAGWTKAERDEVGQWATACHLRASDHEDVEVPGRPSVLDRPIGR